MSFSSFGPFLHLGREPNTQQYERTDIYLKLDIE